MKIIKKFKKDVIAIDCSNLIFRMYYALLYLSNEKGVKTGAIYGFFKMLLFYAERLKIKNFVLFWDTKSEDSWRLLVYPDYKKNRRNESDWSEEKKGIRKDIHIQQGLIFNLAKELGFINLQKISFEADDLIGMFVRRYRKKVKIITMDKDMLMLINDKCRVRVYRPGKRKGNKGGSYKVYNETEVKKEYGVAPKDFNKSLAIVGDKVDDIPGVIGYAYKKASKLINENIIKETLTKEEYKVYERNLILVDLNKIPGEIKLEDFYFKKRNLVDAQRMFDEFEIKSFKAEDFKRLNRISFKKYLLKKFE